MIMPCSAFALVLNALSGACCTYACRHAAVVHGIMEDVPGWCITHIAGGEALLPADAAWEVESWLEWEERQLRSAVERGEGLQLSTALRKLEAAVSTQSNLVGQAVSLADVAVFTTLLPLLHTHQVLRHAVGQAFAGSHC